MPTPLHLTLLITDLHLGGTPLLLRDLALALSGGAQSSVLSPQHFQLSIISLKPLPPEQIENRKSKIENPTIPQQLRAAQIPVPPQKKRPSHSRYNRTQSIATTHNLLT